MGDFNKLVNSLCDSMLSVVELDLIRLEFSSAYSIIKNIVFSNLQFVDWRKGTPMPRFAKILRKGLTCGFGRACWEPIYVYNKMLSDDSHPYLVAWADTCRCLSHPYRGSEKTPGNPVSLCLKCGCEFAVSLFCLGICCTNVNRSVWRRFYNLNIWHTVPWMDWDPSCYHACLETSTDS